MLHGELEQISALEMVLRQERLEGDVKWTPSPGELPDGTLVAMPFLIGIQLGGAILVVTCYAKGPCTSSLDDDAGHVVLRVPEPEVGVYGSRKLEEGADWRVLKEELERPVVEFLSAADYTVFVDEAMVPMIWNRVPSGSALDGG